MKRFSPVVALMAAVVVALALSSCAPAVHETTAPTTRPHATPTPHAAQAAVPSVRVPLTCASLVTDSAASAAIGSPIKHRRDETTPVIDIADIAERQYGSLDCAWGGDLQDGGYDQYLSIDITPDAAAGFTASLTGFANQDPPVTTNAVGDQSVYGCAGDGDLHCSANMLIGTYWVTVYVQNLDAAPVSLATANANVKQILTTVAVDLKSVKALPAWNPPGGALPAFCSSDSSTAAVNSALGVTDFAPVGEDEAETDASSYPQLAGVYAQCTWGTSSTSEPFTYFSVAMLKGGAWVLPQLPGEKNSKSYMLGAYTSMTIPGAAHAAGSCSVDADQCEVAFSVGSVLVVLELDDTSDAATTAALAKIVAAIKAS
jgi:hypothetical protein